MGSFQSQTVSACRILEGVVDPAIAGVVAGVLGTLVMDSLNLFFARAGIISKIDVGMIGRMAVGLAQGRFLYKHPSEMEEAANEVLYGYLTHHAIGVGFAVLYVLGWNLLVGGPASPAWALAYGVATTVASWFLVFPSMGLGGLGRRCGTGFLLRSLEDGDDDVFHVPDHAGNQEKEKYEHHKADGEAHLHPVSILLSHHADNVAPTELAF